MTDRDVTPLRRVAREEMRVWPFAVLIVVALLFADQVLDARKDATGRVDQWDEEGGER